MNKTAQHGLALVLGAVGLLAFATVLHVAFIFPKTVAGWAQEAQAFFLVERIALKLTGLCKFCGLILLPFPLAGIVACVLWTVMSARRGSQNR